MSRTHRTVHVNPRHPNAIPYKRTPHQVIVIDSNDEIEITIERRKA